MLCVASVVNIREVITCIYQQSPMQEMVSRCEIFNVNVKYLCSAIQIDHSITYMYIHRQWFCRGIVKYLAQLLSSTGYGKKFKDTIHKFMGRFV